MQSTGGRLQNCVAAFLISPIYQIKYLQNINRFEFLNMFHYSFLNKDLPQRRNSS